MDWPLVFVGFIGFGALFGIMWIDYWSGRTGAKGTDPKPKPPISRFKRHYTKRHNRDTDLP